LKWTWIIGSMAAIMLVVTCSDGANEKGEAPLEVRLGVVQSLTGAGGVYGKTVVEGIELATREINASDASGMRISLTVLDDASTVEGAKAAFGTLASQGVTAVIGPTLSNVAPEAYKLTQIAGIPALGATTTAAGITDTGDYVFRIALAEAVVVPAVIDYAAKRTSLSESVLILESADAFSRSSADAMRAGLSAIGLKPAVEIDITQTPDVVVALAELRGRPVDAFLITPLVDKSAAIVKAVRAAGYQQQIVGGNSFNTLSIAPESGNAVEDAYVGAAWNPGLITPASRRFVEGYRQAYGRQPELFAAQGYAAVQVLADAVRRAGSGDRAAIRSALAATDKLDTVLGPLSMSPHREAVHNPVVQRYKSGALTAVQ
jgi:branched-chain amino acid transport system substrate-binding protein